MNLFRKAGEKFEETKQNIFTGGEVEYRCMACDEPVTQEYAECPHCGEAAIESMTEN